MADWNFYRMKFGDASLPFSFFSEMEYRKEIQYLPGLTPVQKYLFQEFNIERFYCKTKNCQVVRNKYTYYYSNNLTAIHYYHLIHIKKFCTLIKSEAPK